MNTKSTVANTTVNEKITDQISNSAGDENAMIPSPLNSSAEEAVTKATKRGRIAQIQNFHFIWLDSSIDEFDENCRDFINNLRCIVSNISTFIDPDECIDFLTVINEKAIMIVSGYLGQQVISRVHDISQLDSMYVFCENKIEHEIWANGWSKVKGVFTEADRICEAIKQDSYRLNDEFILNDFVLTPEAPNEDSDRLDSSFMYTQIVKEILLEIDYEEQAIKELSDYCRTLLADDHRKLKSIDKFVQEYHHHTPIWWFTYNFVFFPIISRALRILDIDVIIKTGFLIRDLHQNIVHLHKEQFSNKSETFYVYRGQGLSKPDFQQLYKSKTGVISVNSFLSTSLNRDIALFFAESSMVDPYLVSILFVIAVNPNISSVPFASVKDVSYFGEAEEEVLFSMHTVFRITDIKEIDENNHLWQVDLTLMSANDLQLHALTASLREETKGPTAWHRLGKLLIQIGQYDKAEQIYATILGRTFDDSEKPTLYHQLGRIKVQQGRYVEAISFYEKSAEIKQRMNTQSLHYLAILYNDIGALHNKMSNYTQALIFCHKALEIYHNCLPPHHPDLAAYYNNIGSVYENIGEYSKALSHHEKALEIYEKVLPANHPDLAVSYNNIGLVYDKMGEYSKARSHYEKALKIDQKTLPANHPSLAECYNNIGSVYNNMGKYSKALSCYEKALEIYEKTLSANHPDLGASYNNIGSVYNNMDKYSKALSCYEKALEMYEKTLPANHPDLGASYNNIGSVYNNMGEYPKALLYYEKALEMYEKVLPANHPDLGASYNNIGSVYGHMGEYSKALSYYEKALEIYEKTLPANHSSLAASYNKIGSVYYYMGECSKALLYYEKALEMYEKVLPANHPDLGASYNNIGSVYGHMGEYSKALSYSEKALEIYEKTLPANHSSLAASYNKIGSVYYYMGEYWKALSYYEKALETYEKVLPANHPDLGASYNKIGSVYNNMGECSKALLYFEKALEIYGQVLPVNHPSLAECYNNIGLVYDKMGEYSKALSYYEKALEMNEKILPANHPSLAECYNNNGSVYDNLGAYWKALSCYEKALEIYQKMLPPNHPDLAQILSSIGTTYYRMSEHLKALLFYETACKIFEDNHLENHPDLAKVYDNISLVYYNLNDYSKALSFNENALKIRQKILPTSHQDLAASYDKVGEMYNERGEYSQALSFFEKALQVSKETFPPNYSGLITAYNNIGLIYFTMHRYSEALSIYREAQKICEEVFSENYSYLATAHTNIGGVYYHMGECSKALPFYQQVLKLYEKNLSPSHPDLPTAHKNLGALYASMSDYSTAISFYEKTVEILQNTLPADHPTIAASLNDMGAVYHKMGNCPKALEFFEKAFNIYQNALPSNHPYLTQSHKDIILVRSKMDEISKTIDQKADPTSTDREQSTVDHGKENTTSNTTDVLGENIYIPPTSIQYKDPIGLSLLPTNKYGLPSSKQSQTSTIYEQLYSFSQTNVTRNHSKSVSNDKPDILIVCLDVDSSLVSLNPAYPIEPFKDECACVTRMLSITDACIYFITSASMGDYIIPLVYRHQCIEQIYIYCSKEKQQCTLPITQTQKIKGRWADFDEINAAINEDIQSFLLQSSLLSRSDLFTRCHTQTLDESSSWTLIPIDILNVVRNQILNDQIRIVILHSGRHMFFHIRSDHFVWVEFNDSAECVQFLNATNVESVFFIVSGGIKSIMRDLQAITMLKQIYTVYIFMQFIDQDDLNKMIVDYKHVNGLFCTTEDIFNRLVADIKFYLQQSLYMQIASFFTGLKSMKGSFPLKLSYEQKQFIAFQLFIKTLRQMPTSVVSHQRLYEHCLAYAENESDCRDALEIATSQPNLLINWFVNVPFLSAVINSLLHQHTLNNLFNIQYVLRALDQYVTELPKTNSTLVVYRVQLIRAQDLELIRENTDELIAFHTFIVATKDFMTIRKIARQAANQGYRVVIFEIEIPKRTYVATIDENRFVFQFGSIFRIQSINLAPNIGWYVRVKFAESSFESVHEQLQLQIGERLTWLTLGNYLSALNQNDEAKSYYNHLIETLPNGHEALPSIYNNMGLVNMASGDNEKALECYDNALKSLKVTSQSKDHSVRPTLTTTLSKSKQDKPVVNRSDVYDKMAEAYLGSSNPQEALKFYRKALEIEVDPVLRARLEQRIKTLIKPEEIV